MNVASPFSKYERNIYWQMLWLSKALFELRYFKSIKLRLPKGSYVSIFTMLSDSRSTHVLNTNILNMHVVFIWYFSYASVSACSLFNCHHCITHIRIGNFLSRSRVRNLFFFLVCVLPSGFYFGDVFKKHVFAARCMLFAWSDIP